MKLGWGSIIIGGVAGGVGLILTLTGLFGDVRLLAPGVLLLLLMIVFEWWTRPTALPSDFEDEFPDGEDDSVER